MELVFGKHLGETVGVLNGFCQLRRLSTIRIAEPAGIELEPEVQVLGPVEFPSHRG